MIEASMLYGLGNLIWKGFGRAPKTPESKTETVEGTAGVSRTKSLQTSPTGDVAIRFTLPANVWGLLLEAILIL